MTPAVNSTTDLFQAMAQSIIEGDADQARLLADRCIQSGIDPLDAINQGYVIGIQFVGEQFSNGDMFLPDLVFAGEAMKTAVATLEPEMARRGSHRQVLGRVVMGTIQGDIHDIGKTLVGTMLSASGFEVIDLGVDVPVQKLVDTARQENADLIGISALLTTTMVRQRDVVQIVREQGLWPQIKVMVGGAPVTQSWAQEIGADGYSEDAIGAVALAKQLVG
jgi:corrinoid protein of di/trimethylamine methyltransferase